MWICLIINILFRMCVCSFDRIRHFRIHTIRHQFICTPLLCWWKINCCDVRACVHVWISFVSVLSMCVIRAFWVFRLFGVCTFQTFQRVLRAFAKHGCLSRSHRFTFAQKKKICIMRMGHRLKRPWSERSVVVIDGRSHGFYFNIFRKFMWKTKLTATSIVISKSI